MSPVVITLAGEPVGKGRPRFVRKTGHAFTPATTRKYESALRYAAQQAMAGRPLLDGPVRLEIVAIFPIPASWPKWRQARALAGSEWHTSRPDADNLLKLAGDCLNEIVLRDDRQVAIASVRKGYGDRPALVITVEALEVAARSAA